MGSAAIILSGRYPPPPADGGGKLWVRTSAVIQASAEELYRRWRDVESIPTWQEQIEQGQIDPTFLVSYRITLDEAPEMYKVWRDKREAVTKIVIDPWAEKSAA